MAQSSLTHSLCLQYRALGTRCPCFLVAMRPTVSPGFAFQNVPACWPGQGLGAEPQPQRPLTSFLHLPSVWRLVAPSLPATMRTTIVAPEYAEGQRSCSPDSLAYTTLPTLAVFLLI